MAVAIRDADERDGDFILALNNASIPGVAEMDAQDLADIRGWACAVRIAESDGKPAGFIVLIPPMTLYPSLNYAWFEGRFDRHLYIDRVAVDRVSWGRGVGRALYLDAMRLAGGLGLERLTAEVNDRPPNPESHAFHRAMGFRNLKSRPWKDKVVAMYERPLDPA